MFLTSPEMAHGLAKWLFKRDLIWHLLRRRLCVQDIRLQMTVGHLNLPNPIGLAAGFDKNCEMYRSMFDMGFGYLTLGTVTLNAREGNPKPRMWRYPQNSLVNSMGLPNEGAEKAAANLSKRRTNRGPIVVSISGLSIDEFVECYRKIEPVSDCVELNISTPNTVGVRMFQTPSVLSELLERITRVRSHGKPIWVKIPPFFNDKERENVLELVELCIRKAVDGITAINTKKINEPRASIATGGLSGPLIYEDMIRIVSDIYTHTGGKIPINACGGVSTGLNAWRAFESGASSIQLYTGLIYEGPAVVAKLNRDLLLMLESSNRRSLHEVIGSGLR